MTTNKENNVGNHRKHGLKRHKNWESGSLTWIVDGMVVTSLWYRH